MSVTSYLMNYVHMQHDYLDMQLIYLSISETNTPMRSACVSMQLNYVDIFHVNISKSDENIPVSIQNVVLYKLLVIIIILHANSIIKCLAYIHIQDVFTRFIMHVGASKKRGHVLISRFGILLCQILMLVNLFILKVIFEKDNVHVALEKLNVNMITLSCMQGKICHTFFYQGARK